MNKNTIYYQFLSENKRYSINFDTTEISIGDIKREISRRRNMEKAPEKFELLFYDDTNTEIRDENYKVEPLKTLVIKRIPSYKLNPQFIEFITDPSDILLMKGIEFNFLHKSRIAFVKSSEPLEKISNKLTMELLNEKFKCKICNKKEDDNYKYIPVITLCCYETICETCMNNKTEENCPLCHAPKKGSVPNNSELELKEKLYEIYKKVKENAIQLQKQNQLNQAQNDNSNSTVVNNTILNNNTGAIGALVKPNITIIPKNHNMMNQNKLTSNITQNPSFSLFEKARFFIIKSSNKENLEISQKHSEWATTQSNQKKLNEAFLKNNVILIFSASRTGCFQGYAIMTSFIGDKVSNLWHNENNVKLGGSFGVFWLCCCEMSFNRVKNMTNPLNGGESVTKSRDTQELPQDIGYALVSLCYEQEKIEEKQAKNINQELINKLTNDIKLSREKQIQIQNSRMNLTNNINTLQPNRPMNPIVNNPAMGPSNFYNPYLMPGAPYMYPSMFPMMQPMNLQAHLMAQNNNNNNRERSREKSLEKTKSRSSSRGSKKN